MILTVKNKRVIKINSMAIIDILAKIKKDALNEISIIGGSICFFYFNFI